MTDNLQPSGLIPQELVEQIHKGDCVLFLGTDFPGGLPTGDLPPGRREFTRVLASAVGDLAPPNASPWEIAEACELKFGRHKLVSALKGWLDQTGSEPHPIHHAVARLPVEAIITTAYDDRLERALQAAGKSPVVVVNDVDVPFVGADKVLVLKLFGDVKQPESLVLTDSDQRKLKSRLAPLLSVVRYLFVIKTLLFVGYDLRDELFKDLYAEVSRGTQDMQRRGYAVWPGAAALDRRMWQTKGVELIGTPPVRFLSQVHDRLALLPAKEAEKPESLALLHRRPYKFLDFFKLKDAEVFFGRETESQLLWRKILSYRLVVLFGASGTGKTSLLNAGVWPRLKRYSYYVCDVRVHTDPSRAIRDEVLTVFAPAETNKGERSHLRPAREDLLSFFSRTLQPADRLVILLDQFEELFVNVAPQVRERFLHDLTACVRDPAREVRFVLSLREDFLPHLEALRDLLLRYDANSFRLEPLGRAAAELAITEPAARVGLTYEPVLVGRLLDDLAEGGCIAPPQLQIVCDRLYDQAVSAGQEAAAAEVQAQVEAAFPLGQPAQDVRAMLTCAQYRELGGAGTILADYVDVVIADLPENQREPAQSILKAMITAEETKAVLTQAEAATRARLDAETAQQVLENLVEYRLVRKMQGDPQALYELAHEHLIAKIRSWVSPQELDAEAARRLLDQQMIRFREHGDVIDALTLERVNQQRENPHLLIDSPVELELLFRSALAVAYEVGYWFGRARDGGVDVTAILREGLTSPQPNIRAESASRLGDPGLADAVSWLAQALDDDYPHVRARARAALERIGGEAARQALRDHPPQGMIYIPAGEFIMGNDTSNHRDEKPAHRVHLDAFYIGKYPVTNADYARFVECGHSPPEHWPQGQSPPGKEQHPMVNVTWYDARDYAEWAGMRLLTEAEWEKAASWEIEGEDREGRKRQYPWGDVFIWCHKDAPEIGDTMPVGKDSPQGDSPYGCADMAGNVCEWTSSLHKDYPYRSDDGREAPHPTTTRVLRGSFGYNLSNSQSAHRDQDLPTNRMFFYGFRVGWSSTSSL